MQGKLVMYSLFIFSLCCTSGPGSGLKSSVKSVLVSKISLQFIYDRPLMIRIKEKKRKFI